MDIIDSNAETSSKSTYFQGSNISKSFIDNLYYKYKFNFTNYLIENKDSIKLLVNNATMKKMNVVDYFNKLNTYENLTPIPHMIKKKYKSEKEKKEFSKIERDAVCLRRIEYSFIYKQNFIMKKYNYKIKNIVKIQKNIRGFLFRQMMSQVNELIQKFEKLIFHIKRYLLSIILKNKKSIKKNKINKNNSQKKITMIENDKFDFKNCFSELMNDFFNDNEEKKGNKKPIHIKRKSLNVDKNKQISKNNVKTKVRILYSKMVNKKLKINNINKKKKPLILESYQNIINSMKKTQRKSCVINSFSFNNKNKERNLTIIQKYKRSNSNIKEHKSKSPFSINQIKINNQKYKKRNTNSFFILKTNPIQEVDSSCENNNISFSSINGSSVLYSNTEKKKEKQNFKNETIDSNFEMEIENFPYNYIINNNNYKYYRKFILLILLLKKDITFKIKTYVFNLIKKYSLNKSSIENNFDTIQDNLNEINKDRFNNIAIIYKKAFKLIKKNT